MTEYQSWGRYPKVSQIVRHQNWLTEDPFADIEGTVLAYGQGRSYGDSCLNDKGTILETSSLNRLISFDRESGLLRAEAGATLEQILEFAVPLGWFLPVTPGTKYVSLGGAIANDVHGKNHHRAGTFGCHVPCFELWCSDGERLLCSGEENANLYSATIGGLGLTGFVAWADIQLQKIETPFIDLESIKFEGLEEFFRVSEESNRDFEYTVAWLDCVSRGSGFARGIFMRGNHSVMKGGELPKSPRKFRAVVPFDFPGFTLNRWSIKTFNAVYYNRLRKPVVEAKSYYDPFFYPLDAVADWNRIYGKQGLMQFQCVVPRGENNSPIRKILEKIVASGSASFLAVLKEFGEVSSPGMLSFPVKGVTLCLDFPHRGEKTLGLFRVLEDLVLEAGGKMYPAKDASMQPESFQRFYPEWEQSSKFIDPKFSSSFWRRVVSQD